jgi:hypothetical protein
MAHRWVAEISPSFAPTAYLCEGRYMRREMEVLAHDGGDHVNV